MIASSNALTSAQKAQFREEGYLTIPHLFSADELGPLKDEIAGIVEQTARQLLEEGVIANTWPGEPFETRLTRLFQDHPECEPAYMKAIIGLRGGGHCGPEMFGLITHPRLLDLIECLVGPDIVASSVYRIRPKVPGLEQGVVPWHQDSGYFSSMCDSSLIVTCWIPLVDATPENGCLLVLPRAHTSGVVRHWLGTKTVYLVIQEGDLPRPVEDAVPVPLEAGGVLLMSNFTPHCSTPNTTDVTRWSVDLRYQSLNAPTNTFQDPVEPEPDEEPVEAACYPPEADFIVRSASNPQAVHSYEAFVERRRLYDSAAVPPPNRGWQVMTAE